MCNYLGKYLIYNVCKHDANVEISSNRIGFEYSLMHKQ